MSRRNRRGQATVALNLVLAIFFVGTLAIVAYEFSRLMLARDQLKHCVELAALAGETAIMSSTSSTAQADAKVIALNIYRQNSIHGRFLTTANEVASLSAMTPGPGQSSVYFEFDDPVTKAPSASGTVLRVHGAYNYPLFSGGFGAIGISSYTVAVESLAALPALDLVIVYDLSASMDDQTRVTFVRRFWDPTQGSGHPPGTPGPRYDIPSVPPGGPMQGPISTVLCVPRLGSAVNGLTPQNLDAANTFPMACPKEFSESGPTGNTVPLRGVADIGRPPGDAPAGVGGTGSAATLVPGPGYGGGPEPYGDNTNQEYLVYKNRNHKPTGYDRNFVPTLEQPAHAANVYGADDSLFTDVVVNLDGNVAFGSFSAGFTGPTGPYNFPYLDSLVEASRGNLDSTVNANNAQVNLAYQGVTPQAGYQAAYRACAMNRIEPKCTVDGALVQFMDKVSRSTDAHFGFVTFNDRAGLNPTDCFGAHNVSWAYSIAGRGFFPLPQVPLDPNTNNYGAIQSWLLPQTSTTPVAWMMPDGGTNVADGLNKARINLTSAGTRPGSMKAVLLVTDGIPTRDLAGTNSYDETNNTPALNDAITEATALGAQGIPVFVVALDQTGGLTSMMTTQYSDASSAGIVGAAGHGGVLHIDNWVDANTTRASLYSRLSNVARQLVTLIGF